MKEKRIAIRIEGKLWAELSKEAKEEMRTMSSYIRHILTNRKHSGNIRKK